MQCGPLNSSIKLHYLLITVHADEDHEQFCYVCTPYSGCPVKASSRDAGLYTLYVVEV
jgi:hypothetical protein